MKEDARRSEINGAHDSDNVSDVLTSNEGIENTGSNALNDQATMTSNSSMQSILHEEKVVFRIARGRCYPDRSRGD